MIRVTDLYRYPIKGFAGQPCDALAVSTEGVVGDRRFGVRYPGRPVKATPGGWQPAVEYLQMMFEPWIGRIRPRFEGNGERLTLGGERFDLSTDEGCERLRDRLRLEAPGEVDETDFEIHREDSGSIRDRKHPYVSFGSRASLGELEREAGRALGVERWRMNVWIDGLPALSELTWVGRRFLLGTARFEVRERCDRCRAVTLTPGNDSWDDADLLGQMDALWGHRDLGVLAVCVEPGRIEVGDVLSLEPQS